MHIKCTNGAPIVGTLDHLPPLPLFVSYHNMPNIEVTEQDQLGIYHALCLHGRVRHIELDLWPANLQEAVMLMDEYFPILEHLSLSFAYPIIDHLPITLPKAFLAPNLCYLALPSIGPPRRLRVLTSMVSLVKLVLKNVQTSSYFRPRILVARLSSLPQLKELSISFSIDTPRLGTETELLDELGTLVTLPSLTSLQFEGEGAYLESFVAQIRIPLLRQLAVTLFYQIASTLPRLFYLINITEAFKLPEAAVNFDYYKVIVATIDPLARWAPFLFCVMCSPFDWQIDWATQICHALIPTLSFAEKLTLQTREIPTELQNGAIDGVTWHGLLRPFIGVKKLYVGHELLEELSRALELDEVGLDPGFLGNLQSIRARRNLFASFIDARQLVGRPVAYLYWRKQKSWPAAAP